VLPFMLALPARPAVTVLQSVNRPRANPPSLQASNVLLAVRCGSIARITNQGIVFTGLALQGRQSAPFATRLSRYALTFDAPAFGSGAGTIENANLKGDPLWETIIWPHVQSGSLTISGLDTNQAYNVQLLFGDPRGGPQPPYLNGTQTFTDSSGNTTTTQLSFGGRGTRTELALITVGVSASSILRLDSPQAGSGIGYSAVIISAVSATNLPPTGSIQRSGVAVNQGDTVNSNSGATDSTPTNYQTQKGGAALPTGTNAVPAIASVQPVNSGKYYAIAALLALVMLAIFCFIFPGILYTKLNRMNAGLKRLEDSQGLMHYTLTKAKPPPDGIERIISQSTPPATASQPKYYYSSGEHQQGPVSAEDLLIMLKNGLVSDDTPVLREGESEWKTYKDFLP
jgi:hypothetical protein